MSLRSLVAHIFYSALSRAKKHVGLCVDSSLSRSHPVVPIGAGGHTCFGAIRGLHPPLAGIFLIGGLAARGRQGVQMVWQWE